MEMARGFIGQSLVEMARGVYRTIPSGNVMGFIGQSLVGMLGGL